MSYFASHLRQALCSLLLIALGASLDARDYADSLQLVISTAEDAAVAKEAKYKLGEYWVQREPEKAEKIAHELEQLLSNPPDSAEWGRLNYILAASHRWQGNYKTALEIYRSNYNYYKRKELNKEIAKTGRFIGIINMYLGNNVLAQQHLLECAEIYERVGTKKQQASISNSLASFYLNVDQMEKGRQAYHKALLAFEALNDSAGMSSCNANLGYVYTEMGEYDKAEMHLMKQRDLNACFPTLREMGFHYDFLGLLRQKQERLDDALVEHTKALNIRENLSSTYNLCESKLNMGEVLIKLEQYDEAIDHLNDVLSFDEHESLNQQNSAYELLASAYEKQGRYDKALDTYKAYKAMSDSIYSEKSIQIIAEKDARYQKQELDAEVALLSEQNKVTQVKLNRSRIVLFGSIAGLLIFGLLSAWIYRLYMRNKQQTVAVSNALREKNLLLKEIHHRVKNNLQIISSLLSLQSRYINDQSALDAIKDGRNRVQSMALLHKNLYQEDDLTGVKMQPYFSSLIEGIFRSYNLTKEQVGLELDIADINLDVDTVIPIGLITNELITNSLKYAFDQSVEHAIIEVKLKESLAGYELVVKDNGVGIDSEIIESSKDSTFGQRMIRAFVDKLKAKIQIDNESGTEVVIRIPKVGTA